eukprot:jgi/Chlat1/1180/Chrsp114S01650
MRRSQVLAARLSPTPHKWNARVKLSQLVDAVGGREEGATGGDAAVALKGKGRCGSPTRLLAGWCPSPLYKGEGARARAHARVGLITTQQMAEPAPPWPSILACLVGLLGFLFGLYAFVRNREDARNRQAAELSMKYDGVDDAMDVIKQYQDEQDYYNRPPQIEKARVKLKNFWDWVTTQYERGSIPEDILSSTSDWLARGNNYRLLVEPIDIANWYSPKGANFYASTGKHYLRLSVAEAVVRPRRYYLLEQAYRNAYPERQESSINNALQELVTAGVREAREPNHILRQRAHQLSNDKAESLTSLRKLLRCKCCPSFSCIFEVVRHNFKDA